ncbi:hypothetical protein T492DRAFT_922018 [Pavlovales sp. CCMP2436]|nr:hypothetical protein T492DRAFT_922018 [Pavlovales sp. CCMP2436]
MLTVEELERQMIAAALRSSQPPPPAPKPAQPPPPPRADSIEGLYALRTTAGGETRECPTGLRGLYDRSSARLIRFTTHSHFESSPQSSAAQGTPPPRDWGNKSGALSPTGPGPYESGAGGGSHGSTPTRSAHVGRAAGSPVAPSWEGGGQSKFGANPSARAHLGPMMLPPSVSAAQVLPTASHDVRAQNVTRVPVSVSSIGSVNSSISATVLERLASQMGLAQHGSGGAGGAGGAAAAAAGGAVAAAAAAARPPPAASPPTKPDEQWQLVGGARSGSSPVLGPHAANRPPLPGSARPGGFAGVAAPHAQAGMGPMMGQRMPAATSGGLGGGGDGGGGGVRPVEAQNWQQQHQQQQHQQQQRPPQQQGQGQQQYGQQQQQQQYGLARPSSTWISAQAQSVYFASAMAGPLAGSGGEAAPPAQHMPAGYGNGGGPSAMAPFPPGLPPGLSSALQPPRQPQAPVFKQGPLLNQLFAGGYSGGGGNFGHFGGGNGGGGVGGQNWQQQYEQQQPQQQLPQWMQPQQQGGPTGGLVGGPMGGLAGLGGFNFGGSFGSAQNQPMPAGKMITLEEIERQMASGRGV